MQARLQGRAPADILSATPSTARPPCPAARRLPCPKLPKLPVRAAQYFHVIADKIGSSFLQHHCRLVVNVATLGGYQLVLAGGHSVATSRHIITIITNITRFSCLEADCVFRQAAVKAAKILPLVGHARSKQDSINRGHGAQYLYRPPPAGAKHTHGRSKPHTVVNSLCVIEAKLKVGSSLMLHMT